MQMNHYFFSMMDSPTRSWIHKYTGKWVAYVIRFGGSYKTSWAHMDSTGGAPTNNVYYIHRGSKKVYIVPRQYNDHLPIVGGLHNCHVATDAGDDSQMGWMDDVPVIYEADVSAGDILVFNNCACIHKFFNTSEQAPVAFTMRVFSPMTASPLMLWNDMLNWKGAHHSMKL